MGWLEADAHDTVKAAVHAGLGAIAAVCLVYNACAFAKRRQRHLFCNCWFYVAIVTAEIVQVRRHVR